MSSEGSDIELQSALPKKQSKKMPKSPSEDLLKNNQNKKETKHKEPIKEDKKLTTKLMIYQALIDLKTRKGVSLQAIKKYLTEKYSVDTEKLNYIIKKTIKRAVEEGTIVQVKGIGASGSFRLVPVKEKKKSKPKKPKLDKDSTEKSKTSGKPKKIKEKSQKKDEKTVKSKTKKSNESIAEKQPGILKKKMEKDTVKEAKPIEDKGKKIKIAKGLQTPSKKRAAMMKRKSIGSIIKPPKMKPKSKA